MVHRHRRDHGGDRLRDHVGGVVAAAEAHFEQQHVGGMFGEEQQRRRRRDLEDADSLPGIDGLAAREGVGQGLVVDEPAAAGPAEPDALVKAHEMRRGIDVDGCGQPPPARRA